MTHSPKQTEWAVGDRATNGRWTGRVLATFGDYVWVMPSGSKDGPLTFRSDTLARPSNGGEA